MTHFLIALAAATLTVSLFSATTLPASAQAPRVITQTAQGRPILLGSMTVTATALPR